MLRKSKTVAALIAVALGAVIVLAGLTTAAVAATTTGLTASGTGGHYGDEISLLPSVATSTVNTGNYFEFQTLTDGEWVKWGEGITIEETGAPAATIDPLSVFIDESLVYPVQIRTVFRLKASDTATEGISDPITLSMYRWRSTKLAVTAPKSMRLNKRAMFYADVTPNCGPGLVVVSVKQVRTGKVVKKVYLTADEEGGVSTSLRFSKRGAYRVEMRWLGSQFGPGSKSVVKSFTVR
jgi:hypothetical protein